jgi:hypothetical protein
MQGSVGAGVHPDGCMVETYDQMAQHCGVRFVNGQAVRGMGGRLRGSRAERRWWRLHVHELQQGS